MQKYIDFVGKNDIFYDKDTRLIEQKIIEYIRFLKKEGKSASRINVCLVPVKSFYAINDIVLNVRKIGKFLPENRKVKQDKAYENSDILRMLEIADERMRAVICILTSTGIRLGALPELRLRHLEDNKLTIYEGTGEQYITFCSPECKKAINLYLDMRSRYGEKLKDNSYLIREQYDLRNPGKPKQFNRAAIQWKIYDLCKRAGIDKKNISVVHGFRKFFTTQCIKSKVNPEIREMLLGHKIGLAGSYYRPTEQDMLEEYEKAEDNLTIDPSNRLQKQLEIAKVEKSRIERIEQKMDLMEKMFQNKAN
jgi:integrase